MAETSKVVQFYTERTFGSKICHHFSFDKLSGSSIKWYTDNKNVALILNIGSKKQHLQSKIMQIFNICYPRSINIDTEWIPRTQNERADYLSKFMTIMLGVFPIFFLTGWRYFGVHIALTVSSII